MSAATLLLAGIALLGAWVVGGLLLRLGGLLLLLGGAFGPVTSGDASGVLVLAVGTALWLAGHWHYAFRRLSYKSPLARHLFCRWVPGWLDPTRHWAIPVCVERADQPWATGKWRGFGSANSDRRRPGSLPPSLGGGD